VRGWLWLGRRGRVARGSRLLWRGNSVSWTCLRLGLCWKSDKISCNVYIVKVKKE
jgi:hypothetical protein